MRWRQDSHTGVLGVNLLKVSDTPAAVASPISAGPCEAASSKRTTSDCTVSAGRTQDQYKAVLPQKNEVSLIKVS